MWCKYSNGLLGFTNELSVSYASSVSTSISVYDGPSGTGNLLATLSLAATPLNSGPFCKVTGGFRPFFQVSVTFSGIARSIDFSGTANQVGFDDIRLGGIALVGNE